MGEIALCPEHLITGSLFTEHLFAAHLALADLLEPQLGLSSCQLCPRAEGDPDWGRSIGGSAALSHLGAGHGGCQPIKAKEGCWESKNLDLSLSFCPTGPHLAISSVA